MHLGGPDGPGDHGEIGGSQNNAESDSENDSTVSFSSVDLDNVFGSTNIGHVPDSTDSLMGAVEQSLQLLETLAWSAAWASNFVPGGFAAEVAFVGIGLVARTATTLMFSIDPRDSYWDLIDDTTSLLMPAGPYGPVVDKYKGLMLNLTRDALERDRTRSECP